MQRDILTGGQFCHLLQPVQGKNPAPGYIGRILHTDTTRGSHVIDIRMNLGDDLLRVRATTLPLHHPRHQAAEHGH